MKRVTYYLLLLFVTCNYVNAQKNSENPHRIILLIGDGMGLGQVYAGMTVSKGPMQLERSKYIGLSKTYSANNYITDSGAGATAFATGKKTNNYNISVDTNGADLKTIMESAKDFELATGIVVTCELTHATPACFLAHSNSRYDSIKIANDIANSKCDIIIGGGCQYFMKSFKNDNIQDILGKNYKVVHSLKEINYNKNEPVACLISDYHLPSILKGRDTNYLKEASNIALEKLSKNKNGFFLMIEGSQIDWGSHNNNIDYITTEVIDFDKAVGVAFNFADKNPGTLVVVTADHETGGLSITGGSKQKAWVEAKFTTLNHTGIMVPVYAYGDGAEEFAGIYENTEIYFKMMKWLGL